MEEKREIIIQPFSIPTIVGTIFVTLKLTHVIDWSWWIVTLPFWAPLIAFIMLVVVFQIFLSMYK